MTTTVQSEQATSLGHESHQLAIILPPNNGTLYTGTMTCSASQPVEVFVLYEYDGQAGSTYELGDNKYALSLIRTGANGESSAVGSIQFVGNAL